MKEWKDKSSGFYASTFLAGRRENYPIIDLQTLKSYNKNKPWWISISFHIDKPPIPQATVDCLDAIQKGETEKVIQFLNNGLSPNSIGVHKESLLHRAADYNRIEIIKELIKKKVEIDPKGIWEQRPLWEAVLNGHLIAAQLLLDNGANINSQSHNGGTLLHYTCEYSTEPKPNHSLIQWLIQRGASIDISDNQGDQALHKAAWKGQLKAIKLLIASKVDINAKNKDGETPLDQAINQKQKSTVEFLLKHKAKKGLSDEQ